ncbi:MAG: type II toxin-antitoxin system VapC family toxin, partial [Egibacteraceae bacterium]
MRVLADTHAVIWYLQGGGALSRKASRVLREAAATGRIVVSAATLIDLWYLGRKRRDFTTDQIRLMRDEVANPEGDFTVAPIDLGVIDVFEMIDSDILRDPWDRLITATARGCAPARRAMDRVGRQRAESPAVVCWIAAEFRR